MRPRNGDLVNVLVDGKWEPGVVEDDHPPLRVGLANRGGIVYAHPRDVTVVEHPEDEPLADWERDLLYGDDNVNSPSHYNWLPVEVIDVTEHLNFCLGNVVKYVLRADHKGKPVEDLEKARWYLDREIKRRSVAKD